MARYNNGWRDFCRWLLYGAEVAMVIGDSSYYEANEAYYKFCEEVKVREPNVRKLLRIRSIRRQGSNVLSNVQRRAPQGVR